MWRLKLRETLERFTVLDCKNWTCGTSKIQQQQQNSSSTTPNDEKSTLDPADLGIRKFKTLDHLSFGPEVFFPCSSKRNNSSSTRYNSSSNGGEKGNNRSRISDNEYQLTEDIWGAITWSGAIIFGWYASQIVCTRRRHHLGINSDDHQNKYLKYLYIPKRTIYSNLNSHLVYTSPIHPQETETKSTITLSDHIKYVEIPLLDNKLIASSKANKNLSTKSISKLNLQEIVNSSEVEEAEKRPTRSSGNLAEFSTSNDICLTDSSVSERNIVFLSDEEIKFLNNKISSTPKENRNLINCNNSTDSVALSINNTISSTVNEEYCTEDSSTSFIEFREDSKEDSSSTNCKIYPKTDIASAEIPTVTEATSELVQYIADFEYKVAVQHIKRKDYIRAVPHLKRAGTHLHPNGIYNLGLCYEKGLAVRKNLDVAMECYQKASHLGHPKATFNLGVFYAKGLGNLPKNIDLARKCIITASKLGQPEAISFLNSMAVNDVEIAKYLKEQKGRSISIDSGL